MEYRETLFLPLMAQLVMDESAPASFRGSPAMHCGKLGLFLPFDMYHHKLHVFFTPLLLCFCL